MRISIKKGEDFKKVYSSRKSFVSPILTVAYIMNGSKTRLGLSVSKKNGNAVTRNRIKRVFREAFWTSEMPSGFDFVMIPRPKIETDFWAVMTELAKLKTMLSR